MSRLLDEHYGAADAIKMRVDTSGHMSWWSSDKKATIGPRLVAVLRAFMATELDSILPSELEQASGWTFFTELSKGMQAKLVDAEDLQLLKHLKAQRADAERAITRPVGGKDRLANDALRQHCSRRRQCHQHEGFIADTARHGIAPIRADLPFLEGR
jgi:hypothetical protein